MGTSLSPEQRQALLRAGAKRLLIAYDGDSAGHRAAARLIEAHRAHAIAGLLELAVVALPAGSDPDDIIRTQGPEALQLHLQAASHWLHWELDQLLAPLQTDPDNLSVVQHCEQEVKRLLALLLQGALRQRAEQRLKESLGVVAPVAHAPKVHGGEAGRLKGGKAWAPCGSSGGEQHWAARPKVAGLELPGATAAQTIAIERAERRALRLFLCNPYCRDPLAALVISTDLYRRALQCLVEAHRRLNQPVHTSQTDPLPKAILAICPQLEPHLAALLEGLCIMDAAAREAAYQAPEGETMAILDVLEPVGQSYGS
jgi:DNA primase